MVFIVPTLDEKHGILIALHRALFPTLDVSEMSDEWLWSRLQAAATTGNHAHLANAINDLLPDTSERELLLRWATIRGVVPKTATPARKSAALRVVGTPLTAIPDASDLVHQSSGLSFQTSGAEIVGPDGYVDVDVVAVDVGSQTRLSAGEILTFVTPIANVEEDAELQLALDEDGDDEETDGSLRRRVLSRFSSPPLGGAAEDYVQWALEVTGYAEAYAYPLRGGLGTVDLAALHAGSGTVRAPSAPEVAALQAILDLKRPVSVKAFRVLQVEPAAVDVEVTIFPNGAPEHAFDWDDTIAPTVAAYNAGTRVLEFDTRPGTIAAGHRLIVAQGATGRERVVEALGPGADEVTLEADATGDTPAVGNTIYAGGALVEPVREAIQALFDSLGTANQDTKRWGTWEGNLRPTALGRVATDVDGVLDASVIAPGVTLGASDPDYPLDGTVGLLVAGRILVHWRH
jgi:uncharacterized phage protein gp47/JayE